MSTHTSKTNTPRLRFPEFREAGEWEEKPLNEILCYERPDACIVSDTDYHQSGIPVLTANKSFILGYTRENHGIYDDTPVIIFDDFTVDKKYVDFPFKVKSSAIKILKTKENDNLKFIFESMNLVKFDAKEHKRYYISEYQNLLIPIPTPPEQQKIAALLTSLDDLIAAQGERIKALQAHKKGLMQQLFPAEGERVPRVRFGEFEGEWEEKALGEICKITSGGTPNRAEKDYWEGGNIPWITTTLIDAYTIIKANEFITIKGLHNSSAKIFPKNTILMAMYGQGKTRGKVAILGIEAATNQACAAILLKDGFDTNFVFQNLAARYDEIRELSNSGGQENLSAGLIESIRFTYPTLAEQQKIAAVLTSLDDLLAAQGERLEALKMQKRGLMQGMFPGGGRGGDVY